ncbi:MAG: glycosyltransferase family 4 protein [Chloroflexi bacterium]|nr:glycosyltransferase family 4 protein [Chloroflexota bacterium]
MHLGIDAHMVGENETGNETYIKTVLQGLASLQSGHEITVLLQEQYRQHLKDIPFPMAAIDHDSALRRNILTYPRMLKRHDFDLFFATYVAPLWMPCPVVVAVHDISYVHFPEFFPRSVRWMMSTLVPFTIRRAVHVVTLSESTKQDIVNIYSVPEDKITVTYAAISPQFRPLDNLPEREQPYILAVGNLQPRKNLARLMEAYVLLRDWKAIDHQLVIVGQELWFADTIKAAAKSYQEDILFTGYVSEDELVDLYNGADVFVYPSLYEGFGLPPIEAMACGTPVVTSNISSLPEAVGDAALTVDPYDVAAIAAAIQRVLTDEMLQRKLRQKGFDRAALFAPENLARRLLNVFESVIDT